MSSKLVNNINLEIKQSASTSTSFLESPRYSSSDTLTEKCESIAEPDSESSLSKTHFFSYTLLYYSLLTILIASIIFASIQLHTQLSNPNLKSTINSQTPINATEETPCGSNANSARDAGCSFDPLTFAWLPPSCYDWNLTSEFISLHDWEYFRIQPDGSRRQLSLINIMQSSDEMLYVSWEYHRQHCSYLWLKMHRAMLERRAIDGVSMLKIITGVCDGVLRSKRKGNDTSVAGYITFPSCKIY